jgi:WD40 repeat protein
MHPTEARRRFRVEGEAIAHLRQTHIIQVPGDIRTAQFSQDGGLILTGGGDGTARLWHADIGRTIDGDREPGGLVIVGQLPTPMADWPIGVPARG